MAISCRNFSRPAPECSTASALGAGGVERSRDAADLQHVSRQLNRKFFQVAGTASFECFDARSLPKHFRP